MTRLVLIDGNAILHRAYHALPPLTAPDGSVVNAVYGFTSILIKLFADLKPTYMAVAFDRPEPTFRKSLFKEYQAKRPEMDDDLVSQIPKIQDVVRAFGIPIFEAAGFEADDVIGTVCRQILNPKSEILNKFKIQNSNSQNIEDVVIVTGDRDLLQLVDDRVKVFMPTKGLSEGKLYAEKDVEEKLRVKPRQIPDLKALMGDASDNYPGVAGIGPKTAAELIGEFRSVKKLYEAMKSKPSLRQSSGQAAISHQLSAGVREKLLRGKDDALLSRELATIRADAPVQVGKLAEIVTLNTLQVRQKLEELHFPSLIKRLVSASEEKKVKIENKGSEQRQLFS